MDNYQVVCDMIRQQLASVVWTHKIQEKQADIFSERYSRLESAKIIVSALTTCGIVGLFFRNENSIWLKVIAALFSFITLAISAYYKSFDPITKSKSNKEAANKLIIIRNKLVMLIADCHLQEKKVMEINKEFNDLQLQLNQLFLELPSTSDKAVNRASIALKNNEYSFSDDEIDCFLVSSLKGKVKVKE